MAVPDPGPVQPDDRHEQESAFSTLPVLREERIWGFWDFTAVNVGLAIATWAFLIGGTTALFVGAKAGISAIFIGNVIGVSMVALAPCVPSAKYGLEQYTSLRSVFGSNGTRLVIFALLPLLAMGWNAILAIMLGRAAVNVANTALAMDLGPESPLVVGFALASILLSWILLVKGPVSIEWFNKIVAPGLALMTVFMLILIFVDNPWDELLAAEPIEPFGNKALDFVLAVEINLAAGFSWWNVIGNLARLTRTQRTALWPNMIGLYAAAALAEVVGLLAALALGSVDPTVWMIPLGGSVFGVLALAFIVFANITSMVSQTYATCLALLRALGELAKRIRWATLCGALFLPSVIGIFFPSIFYDNFFKFLAWISLAQAPLCGVHLVDFFFLRRRVLDVRGLYQRENLSRYAFWGGFNPAALFAVALGSVVYFLLLNPITFEQAPIFGFASASIPAFLAAGIVHFLLTKLVVQRLGKGGYAEPDKDTGKRALERDLS
jgi:NCS1 family nucleobase:cation symporter-1